MSRVLCTVALMVVAGTAGAQVVQDPTRPPMQLLHPTAGAPLTAGPQLQSVLISRSAGGRHVAVIDGELVRVGDRVGGARVVAIRADEVQLDRAGIRERLKLQAPAAMPLRPE